MILEYSKDFDKSIKKITDKIALKNLYKLIEKLENAQSLDEISNVVPIINYPKLYRIASGDFRLIVRYIKGNIEIALIEYLRRNEKTYRNYK